MIELWITGGEIGTLGVGTILGEKVDTVLLDAKVGAEVTAAVHYMLGRVVQVGRAGMLHLRRAVTRPRQAEVIAIQYIAGLSILAAFGAQSPHVEHVHVAH